MLVLAHECKSPDDYIVEANSAMKQSQSKLEHTDVMSTLKPY